MSKAQISKGQARAVRMAVAVAMGDCHTIDDEALQWLVLLSTDHDIIDTESTDAPKPKPVARERKAKEK